MSRADEGTTLDRMKKRLDVLLVERGLAESRAQAQALVLAGLVHGHDKPGTPVDEAAPLTVERPPQFVSRGGEKLAHALDAFAVDPAGRSALDVGASTGGFTDVLLQRGAARVTALDVGYGQLHPRLRDDPRVTVLERTNVRNVRDLRVHRRVLRDVAEAALAWPAATIGVVDSGLPGPKGNREFFLHLVHRERPELSDAIDDWIDRAVS